MRSAGSKTADTACKFSSFTRFKALVYFDYRATCLGFRAKGIRYASCLYTKPWKVPLLKTMPGWKSTFMTNYFLTFLFFTKIHVSKQIRNYFSFWALPSSHIFIVYENYTVTYTFKHFVYSKWSSMQRYVANVWVDILQIF